MNWKENLIQSPADIRELILQSRRIAVLGIKTEAHLLCVGRGWPQRA
jgi:hypothetical protein